MDEEFAPIGGPAPSSPGLARANEGVTGEGRWAQLETWEQGRKENVQAPGKWAGAKLKQKKVRMSMPTARALQACPNTDVPTSLLESELLGL